MKKILFTLLMLSSMTAWAGEGDGSKDHPFTGVWDASELIPKLKKGNHLAYDCEMNDGRITVRDDKLNNALIIPNWSTWAVKYAIAENPLEVYNVYCSFYSLEERKNHTFIITDFDRVDETMIYITGHYSGIYDYAGPMLPKKKVGDVEYYIIKDADDYETFRQIVATGNPYANAVLEADITVTEPIGGGGPQFHYRGTFDGQEHTITLDMTNTTTEPYGLFQYTEPGCVIRNLKVSGTIDTSSTYFGSIVGDATGTTIERCISDATLKGDANIGGLIGISRGKCFLENCAYRGSIQGGATASALVGKNFQKVSIKSCYSAPDVSGSKSTVNAFTDVISGVETNLNNHYLGNLSTENQQGKASVITTSNTGSSTMGTRLCYNLNINGRDGVVWYMHDGIPYPFRGTDGEPVYSDNNGEVIITVVRGGGGLGHEHEYGEDHICSRCGYIEDGVTIDPLQNSGSDEMYATGDVYVGLLRYTLDKGNKTAIVKGAHKLKKTERDYVNAIHIPETIRYDGIKYTVTKIGNKAFNNSDMEYCYIPKTLTHIEDDSFNGCFYLKYLHIADCPSTSAKESKLYLGHNNKVNELFKDCSQLEKVYIGSDLRWYTESKSNPDEPFEDRNSITDVFFGPRVTRVGNYQDQNDPRDGWSYDLFNDVEGIKRVYIMGDDQSLKGKNIEFWCVDGLGWAKDYYINRDVAYTKYFEFTVTIGTYGCLDRCERVTYGPFVRKVTERSFKGQAANNNRRLESVDFTNAFRLETIGENAFNECSHIDCALDFCNTQLREIEHDAFYNVDKVTAVNFGRHLETIGKWAFKDSETIAIIALPGTVKKIGEKAFGDMAGLKTIQLDDGNGHIEFIGDGSAFSGDDAVANIYQGRDYEYEGNTPFADCSGTGAVTIGPYVTKLNFNGLKNMKKLGSLSFLYSPNPLYFEHNPTDVFKDSQVHSMFIDRQLLDTKKGSNETSSNINWGANVKENVRDISLGTNITSIPEHLFDHFSALKNVIIPSSISEIGKQAFIECGNLENLYIMGNTHIGREAFARCTNLKHLFLMGQTAKVDELVFDGCDKIEEVVTGFLEASENLAGSPEAFINSAYDNNDPRRTVVYNNAHLVCAGDKLNHKIDFGSINPWALFKSENRRTLFTLNDYDIEEGDPKVEYYDHAYMPHSFTKDKYDLVYAPFQMDSYYFGPDADIYKMKLADQDDGMKFTDDYSAGSEANTYNIDDINFAKVNIDNEKLLLRGVYLVSTKTDKSLNNMASYHNLYEQQTVVVNNESFAAQGSAATTMSYSSLYPAPPTLTGNDGNKLCFVCNEGVLKYVNGEYQPKVGEIVFASPYEEGKQPVFNMVNGEKPILSSKIDLPFNALLEGYATFYAADYNYVAPEWCKVYVVTSAKEGEEIQLEEITDHTITKGQAVLLKSSNDEKLADELTEYLTFATNGSSCSYDGNLLKGVVKDTPANELSDEGFIYVLSCNSNYQNAGFYKFSGDKVLPAGKTYLDPSGLNPQALAKACLFVLGNEATGIKSMSESMSESIYDLMGRRLKESGFKGIYIVNGKKVVIK